MDPLSVAASVTGLMMAGTQITALLQRLLDAPSIAQAVEVEISHFVAVLSQLQPFVTGVSSAHQSRTSMVDVQQIQLILTGSVFTISELQAVVGTICQGSAGGIGFRDRVKWLWAESNITQLLQRLRDHKSSLTLILTLLTWYTRVIPSLFIGTDFSYSQSTSEAAYNMSQLHVLIDHFIQNNTQLFNRVQDLENSHVPGPPSAAHMSIPSSNPHRPGFEQVLLQSHLYNQAQNWPNSVEQHRLAPSGNWSVRSGLSLSQVPNISGLRLAVSPAELSNPQCYTTTPSHGPVSQAFEGMRVNVSTRRSVVDGLTDTVRDNTAIVARDVPHFTDLHERSLYGRQGRAWQLLESGADKEAVYPGAYPTMQMSASPDHVMDLNEACKKGAQDSVRTLLRLGAHLECPGGDGDHPLHVAARNGHHETVRILLGGGANIEATNPWYDRPLHLASINGHHMTVWVLLQSGANIEAQNRCNDRPLHLAAGHGQLETVSVLLKSGASIQAEREFGHRPLHLAASNGHSEIVRALLQSGAGKETRNRHGRRPLHFAASNGRSETVLELLRFGAEIEAESVDGDRPLHCAASKGNRETIRMLLGSGADIEAQNYVGDRPLHVAARHGHCEAVGVFLGSGAVIEAQNSSGDRPLHIAVSNRNYEAVSILLGSGADLQVNGSEDCTPLEIAIGIPDVKIEDMLRGWGARD